MFTVAYVQGSKFKAKFYNATVMDVMLHTAGKSHNKSERYRDWYEKPRKSARFPAHNYTLDFLKLL